MKTIPMKEKRVLIWVVILFCMPVVFAATATNCVISSSSCSSGFTIAGYVSSDGHYTTDSTLNNFPYKLCCVNYGMGSGAISFKYAQDPPGSTGQGSVSINSTFTNFSGAVKLGFQNSCYLKQTPCDNAASEVCIFKTSNSSDGNLANWKVVADNSQIADCTTPNTPTANSYPNYVCCKLSEICDNGVDDDQDGYIDCADQDCNHYTARTTPEFCTGSPYNTSTCVYVIRHENGAPPPTTVYNITCQGQPPITPSDLHFYCSYGRNNQYSQGLCCPQGKIASSDNGNWTCGDPEICGIDSPKPCAYDFDTNNAQWMNTPYNGNPNTWCQSNVSYLWSPNIIPTMDTACCYIAQNGGVGYYTDPNNVRIFGYHAYCGDGIVDSGETCDGSIPAGKTCANYVTCTGNNVPLGTPTCTSCSVSGCSCGQDSGNGG